jgi:PRC-barrel domain
MKFTTFLAGVMVLSLGTVPLTYAVNPGSDQERFQQQIGNEMGVPEPGSIADQESTKKQRNPAKAQRADQNAQVTIGGAKSVVAGEISKIQGEYFFVKDDESAAEVRLLVNKDTNLDCSAASASTRDSSSQAGITKRQSAEQQAPEATERQREQGQKQDETAMGSGFRIGACSFHPGDKIKAEVDDMGRVTLLRFVSDTKRTEPRSARSLGESAGTGELAKPGKQDKPGQLDMTSSQGYPPKQYAILPVPLGEFKAASEHTLLHSPVKNPDGKILGSLESLIMDSTTGQIEYAVVSVKDSNSLEAIPWAHFKIQRDAENKELVLNTKHYQLSPAVTEKEMEDRSPEFDKLIKEMQSARAAADLRQEGSGEKRTASQGKRTPPDLCANTQCQVIRGQVLKLEGEGKSLVVKDASGKEVRLVVDQKTQRGQVGIRDEEFKVGDTIEAYVTPKGHAESINLIRGQGGRPGEPSG